MKKLDKPSVFITSTGRTGTKFFAHLFNNVVPECDAFHEPGLVDYWSGGRLLQNLPYFSLRQLTFDKLFSSRNVRGISLRRNAGTLPFETACEVLYESRGSIVDTVEAPLYVESNFQVVGLIDVLSEVFRDCRIIFVVRDGRDWVRSSYCFGGGWYGPWHLMASLDIGRLKAPLCARDPWKKRWAEMNHFEKNCWLWRRKNAYAVECVKNTPEARLFKFEDIFKGSDRRETVSDILDFATDRGGTRFEYNSQKVHEQLDRKVNRSDPGEFPGWPDWSAERVRQFQRICGGLMDDLGYGDEPEWKEKCRQAQIC